MAIPITCSSCGTTSSFINVSSGSLVKCPSCGAQLIISFQAEAKKKSGYVLENKSHSTTPSDVDAVRKRAIYHLSGWIDISEELIEQSLNDLENGNAYTVWHIPKGNSGVFREITAPNENLKQVQRRVLDRLLYKINVSNAAHGFVPSRSIVTNAQYHLKTAQSILNLDLKDAFPSVSSRRVQNVLVRYLKIPLKYLGDEIIPPVVLDDIIQILVKLTTHNDSLPQGSPCSGYLLNVACNTLDKNIFRLLRNHGKKYRYSRYADDITISSPDAITPELQGEIQKVIHDCGYQINPNKFRYADRSKGQKLEVTGLVLEKEKVRVPTSKMEAFRVLIHQASLMSKDDITPAKKLEVQSVVAFIKMVYGKIPRRIWVPYKAYMDNHGGDYPGKASKLFLDLYPSNK